MSSLILSICVCCRNAASRIEDTLWGLLRQTAEPDSFEILVVDNASDDIKVLKTLIKNMDAAGQKIRLFEEPSIGLSHARNRAVKESRADYVFFIDDDAVANARFVEHLLISIEEFKPDVIGGNVLPLFATQPDSVLDYSFWGKWSLKHFGEADRWLEDREYFIGTNIGALRTLLIKHPFDPELGRKAEFLAGGEEWYLGDSNFKRRFVAGAYVLHKVPAERMEADYFVKRSLAAMHQKSLKPRFHNLLIGWVKATFGELNLALRKIVFQATLRFKMWHS